MGKMEEDEKFQLYELKEANGKCHSVLRAPNTLCCQYRSETTVCTTDIVNILMVDVSKSMESRWPHVVTGWQESIKDKLTGSTYIYGFGDHVALKAIDPELSQEHFTGDATRDLTGALRTVRHKVDGCQESNVRIFIITDGPHDHGEPNPDTEICQMSPPSEKIVSVYILGIGNNFPAQHSLDMRSKMHNGNAKVPSFFFAEGDEDIVCKLAEIGGELTPVVKLELNLKGSILPGHDETSTIHLGEWLYFEQSPDELPSMFLSMNGEKPMAISAKAKQEYCHVLNHVFCQWNSVLIQHYREKPSNVPHETFDLMKSFYTHYKNIPNKEMPKDTARRTKKVLKTCEIKFNTFMRDIKSLVSNVKYENERDLAERILKTTVTDKKYDNRNLKRKRHCLDDYEKDLSLFQKLYENAKKGINSLPSPTNQESCSVQFTSTLAHLQEPNFQYMFSKDKFDFLKSFVMSGIPIFSPVLNTSQINPWTRVIKHILVSPYTILCQLVLEEFANASLESLGSKDKDVLLQRDQESSRFNAIIPIVPASSADILKPIVLSNIYAMMTTFCILKNPHIIDYCVHLATLGCAWIITMREFPIKNRPQYIHDRLKDIVATANMYMDRPSVVRYVDALINRPNQAIMTESTDKFNGKNLKCEALVKPTFLMYLKKDRFSEQQICGVLKLLLREFVGRCLYHHRNNDTNRTCYTDFFCRELSDPEKKKVWLEKHSKASIDAIQGSLRNLLEKFFTLDDLISSLKEVVARHIVSGTDTLLDDVSIVVNMNKDKNLKQYCYCGDMIWISFQKWAQEMGIPDEAIKDACNPTQVMIYISEALQFKPSKKRLSEDLPDADTALETVKKKVVEENAHELKIVILEKVTELAVKEWREAYLRVHAPLVMPMTPKQIVETAQSKGIEVTEETFHQVYRYNGYVRIVRNACQISDCPHYLQPHKNFNQHLSVLREETDFPHALNLISRKFCRKGINVVIKEVLSGNHTGTQKRKKPTTPGNDFHKPFTGQLKGLLKEYAEHNNQT